MKKSFSTAFRLLLLLTVVTGLVYPLLVTGLCQMLFPRQANGSLVSRNGKIAGSQLIAQKFTAPGYFHSRPSASDYNPLGSGGSNLGPMNPALADDVQKAIAAFRTQNPEYQGPIPVDLVTASGSGLDPDISPASALAQVTRVATARGVAPEAIVALVRGHTQGPQWGILGEARVNVLELNLALDVKYPETGAAR